MPGLKLSQYKVRRTVAYSSGVSQERQRAARPILIRNASEIRQTLQESQQTRMHSPASECRTNEPESVHVFESLRVLARVFALACACRALTCPPPYARMPTPSVFPCVEASPGQKLRLYVFAVISSLPKPDEKLLRSFVLCFASVYLVIMSLSSILRSLISSIMYVLARSSRDPSLKAAFRLNAFNPPGLVNPAQERIFNAWQKSPENPMNALPQK
eukprot:5560951-Pleurochrysis_carterae.AAC.2